MLPRRADAGHIGPEGIQDRQLVAMLTGIKVGGDGYPWFEQNHTTWMLNWGIGSPNDPTLNATSVIGANIGPACDTGDEIQQRQAKFDAYESRMKLLKDEAVHDGYVLNPASEIDFRHFIHSTPEICKGNLVLMDNGNLRAIWKDKQGTHLGLQFLGGGMVQYVIFKQREQGHQISRVAGRDTLEGLKPQIDTFGLHSLLYE